MIKTWLAKVLKPFSKSVRRYVRRRRLRTVSLTQFQLSAIAMMAGAFVVGSYFTLSEVLLPRIRALTETTVTIPDDVGFNRDVSGILAGFDDGGGATYVLSSEVKLATNSSWWTTDYTKKKQLSLRNLGAVPLATQSATTQEITVNTQELFDAGALQANCEDLRVVFVATASANMRVEVPRSYSLAPGATDCSDSTATTIAFPLQEPLWANGGTDGNYELYYGNSSATDPGYADQGYSITRQNGSTASATLVCPFNGSTTCVGGETPSTETGAIRYSGGSALQFDGYDDYVSTTLDKDAVREEFTYEAWVKPSVTGYNPGGIISNGNNYTATLHHESNGSGSFQVRIGGTYRSVSFTGLTAGEWHHLAGTYTSGDMNVWLDGVLKGSRTDVTGELDANPYSGQTYGVAQAFRFGGTIDEVRVSDTVRYTSNFTPQTTPFEPDANTKLLLHFDENGDDPRNTGKAFDSSGNGNHGTITGAKYVSGLVGVDNSSSTSGALPVQSTVGHSGIFIEEGTTNLITNPSFENATSYKTNWNPPVTFSLEDQYTTTRTAAALNGTAAEPSGQTRTVVNTNNKISVGSGKLTFATGAAVYDGVWYPAQSRVAGKMLVATITPADTNGDVVFGWDSNQTGAINDAIKFTASGVLQVVPNGGTAITVGAYSATTFQVAAVLRASGVFWFIKGGTYSNWTLLYASTAGTGDGYPAVQAGSTTTIFTADNIRIPTTTWLPTPLAYDSFSRADGVLGTTETPNPDGKTTPQLTWTGDTWSISNGFAINQPSEGVELLSNTSFENGDPPTSWYNQGTPTTHERSSNYAHSGSYSLHLITDAVNEVEKQAPTVSNGVWYVSSGYLYKVASGDYQNLGLPGFNYTGITVGSWQKLITVGRGSVGNQFIAGPTYASENYYDDVSLKALSLNELMASVVTNKADVVAEIEPKFESMSRNHTFAGMVLRMDNAETPNNFILATISGDGANRWGKFTLTKYVSGTYSTLINVDLYTVASPKNLSS